MALGTPTLNAQAGEQPGSPTFLFNLSFAGDGAYPSGGTAAFQAFVRAALDLSPAVEVMAIIAGDCGGYIPVYDKANDKLKVYEQTNVVTSPLIETATANLSGTTFNVTVLCK